MNQQSQAIYALLRHIHSYPCILFGLAHLDICWFHTPCKDLGENRRRFHEHKNLNLCFVPLNIVITTESKVVKLKAACLHKYRDLFAIQLIFQILISTIQRGLPYLLTSKCTNTAYKFNKYNYKIYINLGTCTDLNKKVCSD